MVDTELDMRARFNPQGRFDAAFIEGCDAFVHNGGSRSFRPRTWKERVARQMLKVPLARWCYAKHKDGKCFGAYCAHACLLKGTGKEREYH